MYNPALITSTTIHNHHCSIYLRAINHIATMLSEVVTLSHQGTLLSVNEMSIYAMAKVRKMEMMLNGVINRRGA